jgi:hypothetical protein
MRTSAHSPSTLPSKDLITNSVWRHTPRKTMHSYLKALSVAHSNSLLQSFGERTLEITTLSNSVLTCIKTMIQVKAHNEQ